MTQSMVSPLALPEPVEQFYRESAERAGRSFSEELILALEAHMQVLQQTPGVAPDGSGSSVETPTVPY